MKIVSVIGTRPQLVKAAVVTRALRDARIFDEVTVDTGQHYDPEMSDLLLADLIDVHRTRNLDIHGDDPEAQLERMVGELAEVLSEEDPAFVAVYGDTNSTLAGALAAAQLGIPVGHVEAGLRSRNPAMQEERVRVLVDHQAKLLLCPTSTAVENLHAEQVAGDVHHVGDVMYDAALAARAAVEGTASDLLSGLGVASGRYAIATVHRAETTDEPDQLVEILGYLRDRARDQPVVFPVHPRTGKAIDAGGFSTDGLTMIPPVGYFDMTRLLRHARVVYTDSGGLQKEAYFHRVPCVTLRSETEWVETIDAGWNRLWTAEDYLPRHEISEYGNGDAGQKVAEVLAGFPGRP